MLVTINKKDYHCNESFANLSREEKRSFIHKYEKIIDEINRNYPMGSEYSMNLQEDESKKVIFKRIHYDSTMKVPKQICIVNNIAYQKDNMQFLGIIIKANDYEDEVLKRYSGNITALGVYEINTGKFSNLPFTINEKNI